MKRKITKFLKLSFLCFFIYLGISLRHYNKKTNFSDVQNRTIASLRGLTEHQYSRLFLTLNPKINTYGLKNIKGQDSEYVQRLFGILIQSADKIAADDWLDMNSNVFRNYNTFLLASLMVPFHESGLVHFRNRNSQMCSTKVNNYLDPLYPEDFPNKNFVKLLKNLKKQYSNKKDKANKKLLKKEIILTQKRLHFANLLFSQIKKRIQNFGIDNPFPHCSKLYNREITQLFISADYSDIGLMAINSKALPKYLLSGDIYDLRATIFFGLNHLYNGFNKIAANSRRYRCLKGLEQTDPVLYSQFLIRGAWAGKYNSGNVRKTCRFLSKSGKKAGSNDFNFRNNFEKIFNSESRRKSYYHQYLPLESIERKAFFEILDNIKQQKNNRIYIEQVLNRNYHLASEYETNQLSQNKKFNNLLQTDENLFKYGTLILNNPINDKLKNNAKNNNDKIQYEKFINSININEENTQNSIVDIEEGRPALDHFEDSLPIKGHYEYIITSKNLTVRSRPIIEKNTRCGNTRYFKTHPIRIKLLEFKGKHFSRIDGENMQVLIKNKRCLGLEDYYVSKDYVKRVFIPIVQKNYFTNLKIIKSTWTYDKPDFLKGRRIRILSNGEYYTIQKMMKYSPSNQWIQIMLLTGEYAWIYSDESVQIFK